MLGLNLLSTLMLLVSSDFSQVVFGTYYAVIFSTRELPGFLIEMKNLSKSDCDCLPDCHLMDFQYTVSTTDLMWVIKETTHWIIPLHSFYALHLLIPGLVTRETLTWTLSVHCWKQELLLKYGLIRSGKAGYLFAFYPTWKNWNVAYPAGHSF